MEKRLEFFRNMFLATGVLWFFAALAILIFDLNFHEEEITMTLLIPVAYAVIRLFEKKNSEENNRQP